MQGPFFRMKEHDEETEKGKNGHDEEDQPNEELEEGCFMRALIVNNLDLGHLFARGLARLVPKSQGDQRP